MYVSTWKRVLDLCLVTAVLPVAALPMIVLACLVRVMMGSPILFRHARPGYKARIFTLYKFRTMTNATGATGVLLPDTARLTRLGRVLRRTSLDELPQLFNVLRGDMSFVGPRPLLASYVPLYTHEQARRHDVKPGITGLAQISGRNRLPWEDKFLCDVYYVDHVSLLLDLRILARTATKVIRREDMSADADVAVPRFTGTPTVQREGGGV